MEVSEGRKRWIQLKAEIAYHDELYYQKSAPEISDAAYDALKREFLRLDSLYGEVEEEKVGDDRATDATEARHLVPMLSLEKAYSEAELRSFHAGIARVAGSEEVAYSVEPKIDGMAVSVVYEDGAFARAISRGNGVVGEDVSRSVSVIEGLPMCLEGDALPELIELRGEVFVTLQDFRTVNEERIEKGKTPFSHPRSLAAGAVKLSDVEQVKQRRLSIVFFGLGGVEAGDEPLLSQADFYERAGQWGVPVLHDRRELSGATALVDAVQAMQKARLSLPYSTDGTVVKVDSFALQKQLGESRSAPHWALAYKSSGAMVETRLLGVSFQVGRSGALTPVAELEEVVVSGSRITRASLHNLQEIERMDLRVGDRVFLEKAGQVIPQIVAVDFAMREPSSLPFVRPERCPSCSATLDYEEGRAKVFCRSDACPERLKRRLEHYVSSGAMDLQGWGPATLKALVDRGFVGDIADLYSVRRDSLLKVAHVGDVLADRLLASRESSKHRALWRFVYGFGIPGVGEVRAKAIAASIDGPEALSGYLQDESRLRELERLAAFDVCIRNDATGEKASTALAGKVIVFTGRLDSLTRAEATLRVEHAGGVVRRSLTKQCDYLVVGSSPGGKMKQAQEQGIVILSEPEFLDLSAP